MFVRLRLSTSTSNRLKSLKGRTGLTPNVLCRLALCYSLADKHPAEQAHGDLNGLELNRSTLFGEREEVYLALLRLRKADDGMRGDLEDVVRTHVARGVSLLAARLRSIADVVDLLPGEGNG